MIRIENLFKSFGTQPVLNGVSLEIETGSMIAVVGPSGTGKSVLLKIMTGLLNADAGSVIINGENITSTKRSADRQLICEKLGVLFQGAALFDSINLFDNIAFPLRNRPRTKYSGQEVTKRVMQRLEEVDLLEYANAFPGEVSIGMRKRVGIARALVTEPEVILFDEPNTGLDPQIGQEIYELISEIRKRSGFTGIVISHEIPEVFQVCDRVAMLYQGIVQEEGEVEDFLSSTNPVVRQFVAGNINGPISINF